MKIFDMVLFVFCIFFHMFHYYVASGEEMLLFSWAMNSILLFVYFIRVVFMSFDFFIKKIYYRFFISIAAVLFCMVPFTDGSDSLSHKVLVLLIYSNFLIYLFLDLMNSNWKHKSQ